MRSDSRGETLSNSGSIAFKPSILSRYSYEILLVVFWSWFERDCDETNTALGLWDFLEAERDDRLLLMGCDSSKELGKWIFPRPKSPLIYFLLMPFFDLLSLFESRFRDNPFSEEEFNCDDSAIELLLKCDSSDSEIYITSIYFC